MYDGSESLGIRRFLGKINDVAELGGWSNAEKVTILKLKLAGIAEKFFLSDPTHSHLTEYNDIARVLITRFERTVSLSTRLQLFSSCIQGSSESVQEFAARINKLGTQILQSSNSVLTTAARNANDQLFQSRFISRLRNDIRKFVLARDPNTLDESINAALIEEQNLKLNEIASNERSGFSSLPTESPVISALTDKLQELNLRVERLQEASTRDIGKQNAKREYQINVLGIPYVYEEVLGMKLPFPVPRAFNLSIIDVFISKTQPLGIFHPFHKEISVTWEMQAVSGRIEGMKI
ncbi:uncharacterized protein TNCV_198451 [Trichonephila clavipes]|nr:uncharacterized protein TNCV_198451 [Trichonephila clavipes]